MNKKTAILFLLTLFVLNCAGIHLLFLFQRGEAQASAKAHKHAGPEITLLIPLSETSYDSRTFRRLDKHEIVYRGHRYDIEKENIQGDNLVLKGFRDDKEDKAFRVIEKHQDNTGRTPAKTKPSPKTPVYDLPPQTETLAADTQVKSDFFIIPFNPVLSPFFAVTPPPPEFS